MRLLIFLTRFFLPTKLNQSGTRTAWAVFKYCGTKTVTLRMRKKYENID
jgi:hypothetical protein